MSLDRARASNARIHACLVLAPLIVETCEPPGKGPLFAVSTSVDSHLHELAHLHLDSTWTATGNVSLPNPTLTSSTPKLQPKATSKASAPDTNTGTHPKPKHPSDDA